MTKSTFIADISHNTGQIGATGRIDGRITIIVEGFELRKPVDVQGHDGDNLDTIREAVEFMLPERKRLKVVRRHHEISD